MVDALSDIPLGQVRKYGAFRDNHPEHGVYVFNSGFLVAAHRVAEKDTGSGNAIRTRLEVIWFSEFNTPVCQNDRKEESKLIHSAKSLLERIKNRFHCTRRASGKQMRQKEFCFRKVKSKNAFIGAFGGLYGIHLDVFQLIAVFFLKIRIGSANKYGTIRDLCFVTVSGFELDPAFQIDVPGEKNPLVNVVVQSVHRDV